MEYMWQLSRLLLLLFTQHPNTWLHITAVCRLFALYLHLSVIKLLYLVSQGLYYDNDMNAYYSNPTFYLHNFQTQGTLWVIHVRCRIMTNFVAKFIYVSFNYTTGFLCATRRLEIDDAMILCRWVVAVMWVTNWWSVLWLLSVYCQYRFAP